MIELDRHWLEQHPLAMPEGDTNKNERGRVVVVGGSRFVPGALRLTGEAALRAGAGKLQMGTVAEAVPLLGMFVPEAAVFGLATDRAGELDAAAADDVIKHAQSSDAIVLGPGMRSAEGASDLVRQVVEALPANTAVLLDAAAIAACAYCRDAVRSHSGKVVITPHHGEMAALTGRTVEEVAAEPAAVARRVAADLNAVVVLKAAKTFIVAPEQDTLVFTGGSPGLATGGSGDVLAGMVGGLLARGGPALSAAAWAVWAHGAAGRALTARLGGLGLLGRELVDLIPPALNAQL